MVNRVQINKDNSIKIFALLEAGQLFRSVFPASENNVYMRLSEQYGKSAAVLLTTGNVYMFPNDKEIEPLVKGEFITIHGV